MLPKMSVSVQVKGAYGLTGEVREEHRLGKDGLSDPEHDKKKLRREEAPRRRPDLEPRVLHNLQADLLPVLSLHLLRLVQEQPDKRTRGLDGDEDDEDGVRHLPCLVVVRVEAEVDRAAEDLAAEAVRQPVPQRLALVPRLGVRDGDCGLGHPEDAGRDAA
nr:uncharacterized protein CTRU02_10298 [Colletotrichum truncatum]KAF6787502.1 hypothetical protein CTRU02_10298 [Colletotrichum truncatum]